LRNIFITNIFSNLFIFWLNNNNYYYNFEFTGSNSGGEETAFALLRNVSKLNVEQNRNTTALLSQHINKELGINNTELRIFFTDLDANSVGIRGKLRSDLKD
jgi:hypothetical protein